MPFLFIKYLSPCFKVAHELGHNFGMQHDGFQNNCKSPSSNENNMAARIMAPQVRTDTNVYAWSSCSQNYITGFLDAGRGECLTNTPNFKNVLGPNVTNFYDQDASEFPGQKFSKDKQCQYNFPDRNSKWSQKCTFEFLSNHTDHDECRNLLCENDEFEKCNTLNVPLIDGTECSIRGIAQKLTGWCIKGKCVRKWSKPKITNGGWGFWSDWSGCSRSCGTGVMKSMRDCDRPKPFPDFLGI